LLARLPVEKREPDPEGAALARTMRERAYRDLGGWEPWARAIEHQVLDNGVLVCDATIAAYAFADQVIRIGGPGRFVYPVTSAIGPGLPFGLGAQVGRPDAFVMSVSGDGGFLLDVGDLATAAHHRLPVAFLVFNDHSYNILKRIQDHDFGRQHAVDLTDPDFMQLGRAFGLDVARVDSPAAFEEALAEARARHAPTLIEIDMEPTGPIPLPGF
jgi:acetolactate synthase-1/2/3 large subunit